MVSFGYNTLAPNQLLDQAVSSQPDRNDLSAIDGDVEVPKGSQQQHAIACESCFEVAFQRISKMVVPTLVCSVFSRTFCSVRRL